jgi:ABC-2 type transport system permease protein
MPTTTTTTRDRPTPGAVYANVARLAFARNTTYRISTIGGAAANTIVAALFASVLLATFRQRPDGHLGSLDATAAVTYTFIVYGLDAPIAIFHPLPLIDRIRSGDIAVDLHRPFDVQLYWLAEDVGRLAFHALARFAPPLLVGGLLFDLRIPHTPSTWAAFAATVALAAVLSYVYRFAVALSAFWFLDGRGVQGITNLFVMLLGGTTLPLQVLPDSIEGPARALPYAATTQLPAEVLLGLHDDAAALAAILARQAAWIVVLTLLGRSLLHRATRRLVVQGG